MGRPRKIQIAPKPQSRALSKPQPVGINPTGNPTVDSLRANPERLLNRRQVAETLGLEEKSVYALPIPRHEPPSTRNASVRGRRTRWYAWGLADYLQKSMSAPMSFQALRNIIEYGVKRSFAEWVGVALDDLLGDQSMDSPMDAAWARSYLHYKKEQLVLAPELGWNESYDSIIPELVIEYLVQFTVLPEPDLVPDLQEF